MPRRIEKFSQALTQSIFFSLSKTTKLIEILSE